MGLPFTGKEKAERHVKVVKLGVVLWTVWSLGCLLTQPVEEVEKSVEYESAVQGEMKSRGMNYGVIPYGSILSEILRE